MPVPIAMNSTCRSSRLGAEAGLGHPADAHVVAERRGHAQPGGDQVAQRHVPEADVAGPDGGAGLLVHHAGHRDPGGDRPQPVRAGPVGQAGGDVEDVRGDRLGSPGGQRRVPLGVVHRAAGPYQGALDSGAADIQRHHDVVAHCRAVTAGRPSG
nr:hypothetical protein GCM10020092_007280 [Actinoplanes digitatis]